MADSDEDRILSGYSILVLVIFVGGALIDWIAFHSKPPVLILLILFGLLLVADYLSVMRNRIRRIEGKLDAILKKLDQD